MRSKLILTLILVTLIFSKSLLNKKSYTLCEENEFIEMVEPKNMTNHYII